MSVLQEGATVGAYKVQCLIKQNEYTETYKVVSEDEKPYFLKLYVVKWMPAVLLGGDDHEVAEISILRKIQHKNVVSYITHGTLDSPFGECQYVVTTYFTGDVLADRIAREGKLDEETATEIFSGVLEGLKCIHDAGFRHNDITPANIMLSDSMQGMPEIIDMGHVSQSCYGRMPFSNSDLDVNYCANSTAAGIFNEYTDLFSACAVMYAMVTGHAPWEKEGNTGSSFPLRMNGMKQFRKQNPLDLSDLPVSDKMKCVLEKGLSLTTREGYTSVDELLFDLAAAEPQKRRKPRERKDEGIFRSETSDSNPKQDQETSFVPKKGSGHGFEDIAGMQGLKDLLQQKVIFVIKNKEVAEQYRLTPPNGMLLYGPPGCGKTFFAEKFAEQTAFNFMLVKSSDLASSYIHGTQQKIADLFKKAEENAPTVICFDEFDAFVPDRSFAKDNSFSSEVNEFLSQLNNCSQRGIFVIATSNRPDKIDPAVLRTGRIDKHIYVPLPDHDARREMFSLYLKGRPCEEGVDLDALADQTEGYIASDIAFMVNDAAMTAAFTHNVITQALLERIIRDTTPSVNQEVLSGYEKLQEMMDGMDRRELLSGGLGFKIR